MAYRIGNDVSNTTLLIQNQALIETQLKDNRSSLMGVSIDEEMANILVYQRSFQASARVIEVLNTLLGIVVDRFGS
ncbi:MAG: flagellar hook-associated protein FlgK [Verrucomicrobia bacterium ADurb.Bin474]|nr:MAG: flagellar hook-associated protein FlgK [Verrucomicrobia bacterium ADurb.Bin474]